VLGGLVGVPVGRACACALISNSQPPTDPATPPNRTPQVDTPCGGAPRALKLQAHNVLRGLAVLHVSRGDVPTALPELRAAPEWLQVLHHLMTEQYMQGAFDLGYYPIFQYLRTEVGAWFFWGGGREE